jgi:histone deacetylase 6
VTGTLRPIKSETDPLLSPWYKSHSLIWVAPDHSCWTDPESIKKVRKNRFGSVRQSEVDGIPGMMQAYRHASCSWIEEQVTLHFSELGLGPGGEERSDETESEGEVGEVDS